MTRLPIGVLDSGVGGLSVARALLDRLPGESVLYYADTANFPYGERSPAEVCALCARGVRRLAELQAKGIVVACNTASASSPGRRAGPAAPPVFDVLSEASLGHTLRQFAGARLGLIATPLTVATGAYQDLLDQVAGPCELFALPAPRLVRLVETGDTGAPGAAALVEAELAPLRRMRLDALILGCTHFSFLASLIRRALAPSVALIDPARLVAEAVAGALCTAGLVERSPSGSPRPHRLIVTDGRADRVTAAAARLGLSFERLDRGEAPQPPPRAWDGAQPDAPGGADCRG